MNTTPRWLADTLQASYPPLASDLEVDVLVVGAGITGITAGYLLRKAGKSVAVVERNRVAEGETGHTTAHLTCATDTRLLELVKKFGREHARAVWDGGFTAISQIRTNVDQAGIDCELRSVPGFLVAGAGVNLQKEEENLREEAELAIELGFDVGFQKEEPITGRPAMRIANQAKFHPVKYVRGLAAAYVKQGGFLFEETNAEEFEDEPPRAMANGYTIRYNYVIYATHVPLQGNRNTLSAALLQTKLAAYSTYAIGAQIPAGVLPEILWWDTVDPYHYLRVERGNDTDYAIFGGEDHKTGQETDTVACFANLERKLHDLFPSANVTHHWSGQVIETADGLPYIGEIRKGQFIATGFAGNGMTFGTLSAIMAADAVLGRQAPWADVFQVDRKKVSATWEYLAENKDYPYYLAKGHLEKGEEASVESLASGEGKILRIDKRKVAAFRDKNGQTHLLSPTCPHMGCTVAWNEAEKTWDCPCHGSRFTGAGDLISGPAEKGLEHR